MKPSALMKFVRDVAGKTDDDWKKALREASENDEVLAIADGTAGDGDLAPLEDGDDRSDFEGNFDEDGLDLGVIGGGAQSSVAPVVLALPPIIGHAVPDAWRRALVSLPAAGQGAPYSVKVYFDHHTHSSGVQRGFVFCSNRAHGSCIKYEFCTLAPSRQTFCAWMFAWHASGASIATKSEHLAHRPSDRDVEEVSACMTMVDF